MAGPAEKMPSPEQCAEIERLREEYPGCVKVISNVGEFTNVVNVQPEKDMDIHLKFQLTGM